MSARQAWTAGLSLPGTWTGGFFWDTISLAPLEPEHAHPALARLRLAAAVPDSFAPPSLPARGFFPSRPVSSSMICLARRANPALGAGGGVRPSRLRIPAPVGGSGESLERALDEGDMTRGVSFW